ncbi:YbhB/YbcL family Raf kinase inhibitor-like protein [Nocardia sp. NEAU-G5]|uniref:YbhB/YbcL family Raf kinase inhibitor-like protein n=1 Tax=Nocardia albiluteola TaxID=2842303 RepID=A0ABS6B5D1_9NOCA|nr:YbhB/YbcL family Raf kinase inhibitor-like protein [Nocardia albiluteola]MBU3064555.1 YbhB/YbcL family Raf kinase inhibitor-like protein [Nocardia albiluteola]
MTVRMDPTKSQRTGHAGLAWHAPNLAGAETLALSSPDFEHEHAIATVHAATRVGGENLSPALTWSPVPADTAQLLLVVEDPDAPTPMPFVHCLALLDASTNSLAVGGLDVAGPAEGVRVLRSGIGSGYFGMAPPKSHGPHRYVFQLFALGTPLAERAHGATLDSAKPRDVLTTTGHVLARGRLDGFYGRN